MKKMIKRTAVVLLIMSFASTSTAQLGGGSQPSGYESNPWGCFFVTGACH